MDSNESRRRSIRLPSYDYTRSGAYFVTICVKDRACLFGQVVDTGVRLTEMGNIVLESWNWLGERFQSVRADDLIVMPNHIHGIIWILPDDRRGGSRAAPTMAPPPRKPLGQIIGAFKTVSTKRINILRNRPGSSLWQRNYYEHVIRNEDDLLSIRRYIADNPAQWAFDEENPDRL